MNNIVSHLDITQIFCEVDDFCKSFEKHWEDQSMLPSMIGERKSRSSMRLSEVMTIVIAFHVSGYKIFKEFYTLNVIPFWRKASPHLVSYTRFVELMPWTMMLLCCFLYTCKGEVTGISFIDSTRGSYRICVKTCKIGFKCNPTIHFSYSKSRGIEIAPSKGKGIDVKSITKSP